MKPADEPVSTIAEAEYFAERGFRDITIAAGTTPEKLDRIQALISNDLILKCKYRRCRGRAGDCNSSRGRGRTHRDRFRRKSRRRGSGKRSRDRDWPGAWRKNWQACWTNAGHSYECRTVEQVREVAEQERVAVTTAAERLRAAGMTCETVSVGSTPTMSHVERLDGVTEARPGVYMFGDLFQAAIHTCTRDDIALTVLAR